MKRSRAKARRRQPAESSSVSGPPASQPPVRPISPARKWTFRLSALLLLPLLLLGGLELALRLAGVGRATGFFETVSIGGRQFLVNNEDFCLRFFPPQLARWPGPIMLETPKPVDVYRIVILGESAARGEPEPPYSAARYLEALLCQRFPGQRFEVVNTSITAINSHVILPIARDCAQADADLWIIYMGNNEMVGPFGAATVFGAKAPPLASVRVNLALQQTRIGQALLALVRALKGKGDHTSWGGMKMFLGNQLQPDDPRKEIVYQNFERNLADIVKVGLSSGTAILLNTVAVNLKDCPPFASLPATNLPAADRAVFDQVFSEACAAQDQGQFEVAADLFGQAAKLHPLSPELQFRWGDCLLRLGKDAAAKEQFQQACDLDALPFRADSRINQAIARTGTALARPNLRFFDAAAALDAQSPAGISGRELFFEHVHFTFDGQYQLGLAWAREVETMLPETIRRGATRDWATQMQCESWLALTDWNRCAVIESVMQRLHRPPLRDQLNNAQRLAGLEAWRKSLRSRMNRATESPARDIYESAIRRAPDDPWLRENYAEFLGSGVSPVEALAQWQRICDLRPRNPVAFSQAGRLLATQGKLAEAEAHLTRAVSLRPGLADAWYQLGNVRFDQSRFNEALRDYRRAWELEPADAQYAGLVARVLSKLNRHTEAITQYRRALEINPELWQARVALGEEFLRARQVTEAIVEFQRGLRTEPNSAYARMQLGSAFEAIGQWDAAAREFEAAMRLEPDNAAARSGLERVQGQLRRRD